MKGDSTTFSWGAEFTSLGGVGSKPRKINPLKALPLREGETGFATTILYPGVKSCLCLTGLAEVGLLGAHITPALKAEALEKIFLKFESGLVEGFRTIFVLGNIDEHVKHSKVDWWNERDKIAPALYDRVDRLASVVVRDSQRKAEKIGGFGMDVFAVRVYNKVRFFYRPAYSHQKDWSEFSSKMFITIPRN